VAAEVAVLLDPGDDMHVTVGLLNSHDPARGRVIVHPTPGSPGQQALAHDLLGALGRAVSQLNAEQLAGEAAAWRAVTAWMVTGQIEDLVVLRADRLSAAAWTRVLALAETPAAGSCWSAMPGRSPRTWTPPWPAPAASCSPACSRPCPAPARVPRPGQMRQPRAGLTPRTCRASSTRISATTAARHSLSSAPSGSPGSTPCTGTGGTLPVTG
jgi:hypothetical protein